VERRQQNHEVALTDEQVRRKIRKWLLLLLRFAVTREPADAAAIVAAANDLDMIGRRWAESAPSFFRRTSAEVCNAIISREDRGRTAVLKRHIARIDELRLRRAFQAALDLKESRVSRKNKRCNLWDGLRR
jgi:hypothetical protein